jgi:hypothetical protein
LNEETEPMTDDRTYEQKNREVILLTTLMQQTELVINCIKAMAEDRYDDLAQLLPEMDDWDPVGGLPKLCLDMANVAIELSHVVPTLMAPDDGVTARFISEDTGTILGIDYSESQKFGLALIKTIIHGWSEQTGINLNELVVFKSPPTEVPIETKFDKKESPTTQFTYMDDETTNPGWA